MILGGSVRLEQRECCLARVHRRNPKAEGFQIGLENFQRRRIVVHYQDPHAAQIWPGLVRPGFLFRAFL